MLGMSKNRVFGTAKVGDRGQIVIPQEARRFFRHLSRRHLLILGNEVSGLVGDEASGPQRPGGRNFGNNGGRPWNRDHV